MGSLTYPTIEHVAMQARTYPTDFLEGCETGLCLFAAAFCGHNDSVHLAEAGIRATCVDIDGPRLAQMAMLYPKTWQFAVEDAWKFADAAFALGEKWDVVSVDPFTGSAMVAAISTRDLWTHLARRLVALGVPADIGYVSPPQGWKVADFMPRSEVAAWLVMVPE